MQRPVVPLLLALTIGCGRSRSDDTQTVPAADDRGFEPPVATNPESPVRYPPALYEQRIEGTVVLRLFVDETGSVIADSTRIAEGSGNAALDSAALAAVPLLRFAPAHLDGTPVATAFLQPVQFRHPGASGPGGGR